MARPATGHLASTFFSFSPARFGPLVESSTATTADSDSSRRVMERTPYNRGRTSHHDDSDEATAWRTSPAVQKDSAASAHRSGNAPPSFKPSAQQREKGQIRRCAQGDGAGQGGDRSVR